MAYEKTVWVNGQAPALDAYHLNKMEQGIADAVSVTPQTLSDGQKTQARTNINSAPGGFGLGGSPSNAYIATNGDDINAIGWYVFSPQIAGFIFGYSLVRHEKYDDSYAVQTAYLFDATSGKGKNHVIRRVKESSTWYPWEWVNPPMQLGIEYRTTERYMGKPVYVKTVDTGALPNATYKEISASFPNANRILSVYGSAYQDADHVIPLPCLKYGKSAYGTDNAVQVTVNNTTSITISTLLDMSGFTTSSVCVKYTKSTD